MFNLKKKLNGTINDKIKFILQSNFEKYFLIIQTIYRKPLRIGAAVNTKPYNYRNADNPSHFM